MEEYRLLKFNTNNIRMLIVAAVLTAEQFVLGFVVADAGSLLRRIYFISSAVMLLFVAVGLYYNNHKPALISFRYEVVETGFAAFGMFVAVIRFLFINNPVYSIPTIYIAVLYGVAVIFVFNRWQGMLLYLVITITTLFFFPRVHPEIRISNYDSDIITNGFIAGVILMLNTRRFISAFLDKKRIETINNELLEQSIRDGLTGLYNRRKLDELFSDSCLKSERYSGDFSLMMIDIDNFKNINDTYGHHAGDRILIEFSEILRKSIREVDICGRWGGEEFLIICRETDLNAAVQLAERLRLIISKHEFSDSYRITASFGVAAWSEFRDGMKLLNTSDSRMYTAKSAGKNRVVTTDGKN